MTGSAGWVQRATSADRLALIEVQLARNVRASEQERALRIARRLVSVLSLVASVVGLFDLSLLIRLTH